MTQITQEEIRDALLSLYEEHEGELISQANKIEKIEKDAIIDFEKKIISIKNKIAEDVTVPDEELEIRYLIEIELAHKAILKDTKNKIQELIDKQNPQV